MLDFNRSLIEDMRAHGGHPSSGPFLGRPVLILITKGRQSGGPRETPLVYMREEDAYLVFGSRGGHPTHPAWYLNLLADPDVEIEVNNRRMPARAQVVEGEERDRIYAEQVRQVPAFAEYEARAGRVIPVVRLRERA